MSGPKPKPGSVRTAGRRQSREEGLEVPVGRPPCPVWFSLEAKREWRRVVPSLESLGLLALVDRAQLANYCEAWSEWVKYQADLVRYGAVLPVTRGTGDKAVTTLEISPYVKLAGEARDRMSRAAAMFGFSPVARIGLKTATGDKPVKRAAAPKSFEDTRAILRVLEGGQ